MPWGRFIQGRRHTLFCGAYTLINTQEVAVMSGLAAAERLHPGSYPFGDDRLAALQFDMYLSICHGKRRAKPKGGGGAPPVPAAATATAAVSAGAAGAEKAGLV